MMEGTLQSLRSSTSKPDQKKRLFRFVTASSLFDGHDASINVFRRLIQKAGAEVVHLGHNRSVLDIVLTAIQEDADAICVSSYQGGHMEYFRYMVDLLREKGYSHIRVFGGGGGTMLPQEIQDLEEYGVTRIYHAEDGRVLGLDGVIEDLFSHLAKAPCREELMEAAFKKLDSGAPLADEELGCSLSLMEERERHPEMHDLLQKICIEKPKKNPAIIGITGPGGAGKSSLTDELITRYLHCCPKGRIGVLAFDPTKKKTGGALLGDRIRMNSIYNGRVFLRSLATRHSSMEVGKNVLDALNLMRHSGFDLIFVETSGIGQGNAAVVELCHLSLYVMTSEYGASSQLEKIDMIDFADLVAINKFDKQGAEDALADVLHQYAYSRDQKVTKENRHTFPVFGTTASDFNDPGVSNLFRYLLESLLDRNLHPTEVCLEALGEISHRNAFQILPPHRTQYLQEISQCIRRYRKDTESKGEKASLLYQIQGTLEACQDDLARDSVQVLREKTSDLETSLGSDLDLIHQFFDLKERYEQDEFSYQVRGRTFTKKLYSESLSETHVPKIASPRYRDWGDILRFMKLENFPGYFPFTSGIFPLRNEAEDPKRQFAGEGCPARTNKRFHYLSRNDDAKRLSTAFDSVTLYGEDPSVQPDVYGKVGNSGVSIATLDHMKTLFAGFDLVNPLTSVSLTINGPAPMILAMFLNTAIDFELDRVEKEKGGKLPEQERLVIREDVLQRVRGTVQADILKEEQGQNTCIFSSKFALKMMGDIQEYFIEKGVRNFYSVSISGYHIAEAGANPISQVAFTLSNGFTFVEYYLARGMDVDDFARNLSFFFSNGLDPEYAVIGRVARRIWSVAIREHYEGGDRSQKLKYHIQTSGRSLHAQEIQFNDIRTTLQALLAYYDNCNSLHTNAYDEAITTPTEESVRRAMAIQLIIAKEYGLAKCENVPQGSFIIETLTDLVEEAILQEFEAISRRGGVLGAMEKQYQRHKIQTESLKYERLKSHGDLPIIGVNTFVSDDDEIDYEHMEVIRASDEEKQGQIQSTKDFIEKAGPKNQEALDRLREVAITGGNLFEELMETVRYASLGQITQVLYQCGGEYRRSM